MSGEPKDQSRLGPVIWRFLAGILLSLGLYLAFSQVWDDPAVYVSLHALLGFLAIIALALQSYDARTQRVVWKHLYLVVFAFLGAANFVAALWHLWGIGPINPLINQVFGMIELFLLGMVLLIIALPGKFHNRQITWWEGVALTSGGTITLLVVYGFSFFILVPLLFSYNLAVLGWLGAVTTILVYATILLLHIHKIKNSAERFPVGFYTGLLLLTASAISLSITLIIPIQSIVLSNMLRAAAIYGFFTGIAVHALTQMGISNKMSHVYASSASLLVVIPYLVTLVVVYLFPISPLFKEQGIYTVTHFGVAFLAAISTRLLTSYAKQQPHWHRYPLMLAFVTWTSVEVSLVFTSPFVEITGEYNLLYLVGSLLVLVWLILVLWWIVHPPKEDPPTNPPHWAWVTTILIIIIIIVTAHIQTLLQLLLPLVNFQLIFRSGLLAVCFVSLFILLLLFAWFLRFTKGNIGITIIALGLLSLWVVANLIKISFLDWTAGWWSAEFLLLFGLFMGPAAIGLVYLEVLKRVSRERQRTLLYADILVHDLRNYHQVLDTAVELLRYDETAPETREMAYREAITSLQRAEQLISNVRMIDQASNLDAKQFKPIDLVATIDLAWKHILDATKANDFEFVIHHQPEGASVLANDLLLEVFINLFRNAVNYSPEVKRIHVLIEAANDHQRQTWKIQVIDWGKGIPDEEKRNLFKRYTQASTGVGLGLSVVRSLVLAFGGTVCVENRVPHDYRRGTVFIVVLPAYESQM